MFYSFIFYLRCISEHIFSIGKKAISYVRISYIQCSDLLDEICCHNSNFGKNERYFLQIYWRNFCVYLWQVCLSLSRDLCRLSESKRPRLVGRSRIILSLLVERISTCLKKYDHLSATLNCENHLYCT